MLLEELFRNAPWYDEYWRLEQDPIEKMKETESLVQKLTRKLWVAEMLEDEEERILDYIRRWQADQNSGRKQLSGNDKLELSVLKQNAKRLHNITLLHRSRFEKLYDYVDNDCRSMLRQRLQWSRRQRVCTAGFSGDGNSRNGPRANQKNDLPSKGRLKSSYKREFRCINLPG